MVGILSGAVTNTPGLGAAQQAFSARRAPRPQLQSSTTLGSYAPRDPNQQLVSDWIVAVVNSEPITHQELQARLLRIELQLQNSARRCPIVLS